MKKIFMIMLFVFLLPFSVKAAETDNNAASASDFEYTITDKKVTIDKYIGEDSTVVIPDKLNSCPVSKIGSGAFKDCDFITQVKCSDDITEIGSSAFAGCSKLENLILPKNLKTLGYYFIKETAIQKLTIPATLTKCYAYNTRYSGYDYDGPLAGAESLTDIVIESGMENIPEYLACISSEKESHINKIAIPDTVKTIKGSAFSGCKELSAIRLPDSVVTVGNYAFYNNESLKEIQFSSNLETIGVGAFENCKSLEMINIPKTVTSIKGNAFTDCTGLEKVVFNNNTKNGVLLSLESAAFSGCKALTDITFSKNIVQLGSGCFSDCTGLTSLELPDNITEIKDSAFSGCSELESLILPKKLKTLGYYFISGTAIRKLTIPAALTKCYGYNTKYNGNYSRDYDGPLAGATNLTDIVIESGMESIPEYLACISKDKENHINKIEIPDTVKTIQGAAFSGCKELSTITLPDSVITVGNYVFYNNDKLKEIQFSSNLETIGSYAFGNCKSLEMINVPKTVTSIKGNAFSDCMGLEKVVFNDNAKHGVSLSLESEAFSGCKALTEITFSKNIVQLGSGCFRDCTGLMSLELPDNITEIKDSVFSGCSELESLILPKKLKTLGYYFISGTAIQKLTIPATLTKCYGYNTKYNGNYSADYDGPLAGAKNLTDIVIESGMESIPEYLACISKDKENHINKIEIPDTVKTIQGAAFSGCKELSTITLPDSVITVGNYVFYNNDKLKEIQFSSNLETIGSYAFGNCKCKW